MKVKRDRRRQRGLFELRLVMPDARSEEVRKRVAAEVTRLGVRTERDALRWIEAVCEFDADEAR